MIVAHISPLERNLSSSLGCIAEKDQQCCGITARIQLETLDRGGFLQANFRYMAGLAAPGGTRLRVVGAKPRMVDLDGNRASLGVV